jgi:hypothetical protein
MESNNHSHAIPPETVELVKQKARETLELLAPYATPLTPQERRDLPVMGEKTVSFVEKAFEFAEANPDLCPNYLDMAEFRIDFADAIGLRVVHNSALQVFETVDDIALLAGSEAYQSSLAFYNYVKLLASQDVPGAKAIYEELKKRFPRHKRKNSNENGSEAE